MKWKKDAAKEESHEERKIKEMKDEIKSLQRDILVLGEIVESFCRDVYGSTEHSKYQSVAQAKVKWHSEGFHYYSSSHEAYHQRNKSIEQVSSEVRGVEAGVRNLRADVDKHESKLLGYKFVQCTTCNMLGYFVNDGIKYECKTCAGTGKIKVEDGTQSK